MYKIVLTLLVLSAGTVISRAQTAKPDMTVFGYTIGEKLTIPECPCKIAESKTMGNSGVFSIKHFKGYQYVTGTFQTVPVTCFERADIGKYTVRKSEQLNPLPPFTDGVITVRFAAGDTPAKQMCPLGTFDANVEHSKITMISFTIYAGDADAVFQALKNKYGTNVAIKNGAIQNGYGASLNYYLASWSFPNLEVLLQSSLHRSLSEQFGSVTIAIPQKSNEPEAKRKL